MPKFQPGQKGIAPKFTVCPERQLTYRINGDGKRVYTWEKYNHDRERIDEMDPYHIIQIMRAMFDQGIKYIRAWYLFDQQLRRRGVGMTGRITRLNGGRQVVIYHGPGYSVVKG